MTIAHTAEQKLLVASAYVGPEPERRAPIERALAFPPDPDEMARLARAHGMLPLLARALNASSADASSLDLHGSIRFEARQVGYRNVYLAGELVRLLRLMQEAGVPALPFKGPTLAVTAYGSLDFRHFVDLDLLVPPERFAAAKEVLQADGYVQRRDEWAAVRHFSHEVTFDGRNRRVEIDLHRRTFSRELTAINLAEIWARLDCVRLGGVDVPTIRPEWLLVILAEHAHKHHWSRLVWVADLAHLIAARPGLDWDELFANALRVGGQRVLGIGLTLALRLLAAPLPGPVVDRLKRDPLIGLLASELEASLLVQRSDKDAARLELGVLQWRSRERWRDRLRFVLTPNEDDWLVLPLPAPLFAVYYLIRPVRVLARYGARWVRRAAGRQGVSRPAGSDG